MPEERDSQLDAIFMRPTGAIAPYRSAPQLDALMMHGTPGFARPEWRDEHVPAEERQADFLQTQARSGLPWEQAAPAMQRHFSMQNPEAARGVYEQERLLEQSRQKAREAGPETSEAFLTRHALPFVSTAVQTVSGIRFANAARRVREGNAQPGDYDTVASYEERQRQEGGLGGSLATGLASIPAVVGEFAVGGAALRGAGLLGQTPAAGARAFAGRTLAQTAAAPTMYLPDAVQRNIEAGRSGYDPRGLPFAYAHGAINTAILGSLGHIAGDIPGESIGAVLKRTAARVGTGMVEQQVADVVGSATGLQSGYGVLGSLLRGDTGEALQHATVQAVTFAAFAGLHEREGRDAVRDRFLEFTRDLQRQGLTREAAGRRAVELQTRFGQALTANPEIGRPEILEMFRDVGTGAERRYIEALASHVADISHAQAVGPDAGYDRETAPQQAQEVAPGRPEAQAAPEPTQPPPAAPQAPPAAPEQPAIPAESTSQTRGTAELAVGGPQERRVASERAQAELAHTPAVYVDMDVDNLGGLVRHAGEAGAAGHVRAMLGIIHEELSKVGATEVFRHASDKQGDEHSAIVRGRDVYKGVVEQALSTARTRIEAYNREHGLTDLPHHKSEHPDRRGVGITTFPEEFQAGRDWRVTHQEAELGVSSRKGQPDRFKPTDLQASVAEGRRLQQALAAEGLTPADMQVVDDTIKHSSMADTLEVLTKKHGFKDTVALRQYINHLGQFFSRRAADDRPVPETPPQIAPEGAPAAPQPQPAPEPAPTPPAAPQAPPVRPERVEPPARLTKQQEKALEKIVKDNPDAEAWIRANPVLALQQSGWRRERSAIASENPIPADVDQQIEQAGLDHRQARAFRAFLQSASFAGAGKELGVSRQAATKSVNNALAALREKNPETWGQFRSAREVLDHLGTAGLESLSRRTGGEARAGEVPDVPDQSVANFLSSAHEDSADHIGTIRDSIDRLVVMADRLEKDPVQHVMEAMPELVRRFGEQQTREIINAALEAFHAEHPEYRQPNQPPSVRPETPGGLQQQPEVRPSTPASEGGGGLQGPAARQGGEGTAETPGSPEVPEAGAGRGGASGRDQLTELFANLEAQLTPQQLGMVSMADLFEKSGLSKADFEAAMQEKRRSRELRFMAAGDPRGYADPRMQAAMIRGDKEIFTAVERGRNYRDPEAEAISDASREINLAPAEVARLKAEADQSALAASRAQAHQDAAELESGAAAEPGAQPAPSPAAAPVRADRVARMREALLRKREVESERAKTAGSPEQQVPVDPGLAAASRFVEEESGALTPASLAYGLGGKYVEVRENFGTLRKWFRELWGHTAPRTAAVSQLAANAVAEHMSAPSTARQASLGMQDLVVPGMLPEVKKEIGAAYQELRLRHEVLAYREKAAEAMAASAAARIAGKAGEAKAQSDLATEYMNNALEVRTFIGAADSPFKTEADFQRLINHMPLTTKAEIRAALDAPALRKTSENWRRHMVPEMERNFRDSQGMEDTDPINTFTQIEGFPINMHRIEPGEPPTSGTVFVGGGRGNLANVRNVKLGAARQAKGTAEAYETDLGAMIERSLARGIGNATKQKMLRTLLEEGVAVRARPGERPEINDQPTEKIDGVFRSDPVWGREEDAGKENLHLLPAQATEVRRALGPDKPTRYESFRNAISIPTRAMLVGVGEVLGHAGNMARAFFLPQMSFAEFYGHAAGIATGAEATTTRLMELARMGAMKESSGLESGVLWGGKLDPTYHAGKFIDFLQKTMRLTMDSAFTRLVEKGRFPDSEVARRDWINSNLGNYNKKAGNALVTWLKDSGLGPFAVAATTNLGGAIRSLTANPGLKGSTFGQTLMLRGEMLGRMAVFAALAPAINYLVWGKAGGDDNTPFGDIKLGVTAEGRTIYLPWLSLTGLNRGARATGLQAIASGIQNTATPGQIATNVGRDWIRAGLAPAEGPAVQFAHTALSGSNLAGMNITQPPGPEGSRGVNQLAAAAANANPAVAALGGWNNPRRDRPLSERLLGMLGTRGPQFRSEVERLNERFHVVQEQRQQWQERARVGQAFPREQEYAVLHAFVQANRQLEEAHAGRGTIGGRVGQGPVPNEERQRQLRLQQVDLARRALGMLPGLQR